jgi:hypothetical protein
MPTQNPQNPRPSNIDGIKSSSNPTITPDSNLSPDQVYQKDVQDPGVQFDPSKPALKSKKGLVLEKSSQYS